MDYSSAIDVGAPPNAQGWLVRWKRFWAFAGPGLLVSIAYVDPGNLESDLQVGARTGYSLLWLVLWSTLAGLVIQLLAAKLGVATGKDLAQQCRLEYRGLPRYGLWLMVELAIVGSDIQEVVGTALAIELLTWGAVPLWLGVLITATDSFMLLYLERLGVRSLEAFFGVCVATMCVTFGWLFSRTQVPVQDVVEGLIIPRVNPKYLTQAVGMVGALVMPHNVYLHSALVMSRKLEAQQPLKAKREAITYFAIESAISLGLTVIINVLVVSVFAHGFYGHPEAGTIGLQNGGQYLGREYGWVVQMVWAVGLLAAGQSSTMTGTYTGQFVMSGFLNFKMSPWKRAALTRSVALGPALLVALLGRGSGRMDALNEGLNVLQSMQLPFALIPVLMMTSSRRIMGDMVVARWERAMAWIISGCVLAINMSVVMQTFLDAVEKSRSLAVLCSVGMLSYISFVVYILLSSPGWSWTNDDRGPKQPGCAEQALLLNGDDPVEENGLLGSPGDVNDASPPCSLAATATVVAAALVSDKTLQGSLPSSDDAVAQDENGVSTAHHTHPNLLGGTGPGPGPTAGAPLASSDGTGEGGASS